MSTTPCFQCGEEGTKFIQDRGRNQYCLGCWNTRVVSRVRKRLVEVGRSLPPGNPEKALIFLSGSSSTLSNSDLALISLCHQASASSNNPRALPFPFQFSILVILEDPHFPQGSGLGLHHLSTLMGWLSKAGIELPVYTTEIGDALREAPRVRRISTSGESIDVAGSGLRHDLTGLVAELRSKTSQNDLTRILRFKLLGSVANSLGITRVLLPESQTILGSNMFSLMALGRGSQLGDALALSSPWNGLTLCRILMDFLDDELTQYLTTLEENDPVLSGLGGRVDNKQQIPSLDGHCLEFITNLSAGYPSTVSTLTRIGGKLQQEGEGVYCLFCKGNCDKGLEGVVSGWCYGCSMILKEMKNPDILQNLVAGSER